MQAGSFAWNSVFALDPEERDGVEVEFSHGGLDPESQQRLHPSVIRKVLLCNIDDLMVSRHATCLAVGLIIQGLGICGTKGFVLGSFRQVG
jgi:hypothetical protein